MAYLAVSRKPREISRACVLMLIAQCTLALAVAQPVKDVAWLQTGVPRTKLAQRATGLQSLADAGASASAQSAVHWILDTGDHQQLPFAVVDKIHARVFVFHRTGRLLGNAPVLLGQALGDEGLEGVGEALAPACAAGGRKARTQSLCAGFVLPVYLVFLIS